MNEPKENSSQTGADAAALIYVVDDEPMLLELASVILEPCGYEVRAFRDPAAALQSYTAAQPQPELLITDYAMHSMDGLELMRACRKLRPEQKVLLVSGTVDERVFRNRPDKPDRFLAKPYQARQLVELVRELLNA